MTSLVAEGRQQQLAQASGPRGKNTRPSMDTDGSLSLRDGCTKASCQGNRKGGQLLPATDGDVL